MRRAILVLALMPTPLMAAEGDCAALGLTSAYLADYFCSALGEVSGTTEATRSIVQDGADSTGLDGLAPALAGIPVIREAWRVDPKKTLELIERIRSAGGLQDFLQ